MMINSDTQSFHFLLRDMCPLDVEILGSQSTSRNLSIRVMKQDFWFFCSEFSVWFAPGIIK